MSQNSKTAKMVLGQGRNSSDTIG